MSRCQSAFTAGPTLRLGRYKHAGSSLQLPDGRILLAGGASQAELLDPATGVSALVPAEGPLAGQFPAVAPLPGGWALITGGYGPGRGPAAAAWRFRP